jgi:death-on-curing family protein
MASTTTKTLRFLTSAQVTRVHKYGIALREPSQQAMLESAINSPANTMYYENEENIFQLAANLSEKIMMNHAYQDGNKRTALLAADMFLRINGYQLQKTPMADNDEVSRAMTDAQVAVVTKKWERQRLGEFYESIAAPTP